MNECNSLRSHNVLRTEGYHVSWISRAGSRKRAPSSSSSVPLMLARSVTDWIGDGPPADVAGLRKPFSAAGVRTRVGGGLVSAIDHKGLSALWLDKPLMMTPG